VLNAPTTSSSTTLAISTVNVMPSTLPYGAALARVLPVGRGLRQILATVE